ncbi:AfsR/SARP family transcriptional regulator [Micromonospora arida]|uniref:AfsR/SARP family transcriptional regulator n=1 Tax=Micromonospora arida TaxID=2203715 RepID=UPI0033E78DC9
MSHSSVDLHVLGPVTATNNGAEVLLGPPQQRTVLAALMLRPGRVVAVDELVDAVWGEHSPATARKAIQVYVSRLRRALPWLDLRSFSPGYRLDIDPEQIDLHRFRVLVREAGAATGDDARELLRQALAQWQGDVPLACLGDTPLARTVRPVLGEERLAALQRRIGLDMDAGRHLESVSELLSLTSTQPYRESVHALLMRALYRAGRSAEAVAAYHDLEARLERDLGTEPGAELRRLHAQILQRHTPVEPSRGGADVADIERINDVGQVTELLRKLARDAREVLAVHPDRQGSLAVLPYYLGELRRGRTTWRTIVHRRCLSRPDQIRYATRLHQAGDRHRVTDRPVQRMVLLDRRVAFVPCSPGQRDSGALVIRNAAVTATLAELFEHTWANSIDITPDTTTVSGLS